MGSHGYHLQLSRRMRRSAPARRSQGAVNPWLAGLSAATGTAAARRRRTIRFDDGAESGDEQSVAADSPSMEAQGLQQQRIANAEAPGEASAGACDYRTFATWEDFRKAAVGGRHVEPALVSGDQGMSLPGMPGNQPDSGLVALQQYCLALRGWWDGADGQPSASEARPPDLLDSSSIAATWDNASAEWLSENAHRRRPKQRKTMPQ